MNQEQLLYTDDLTGVKNRRYIRELTSSLIPTIEKKGGVYTIAIVDLDHFKEVNDTYGHLKGDEVIKSFAQFLKERLRKDDMVIRYGGDEFIIFQPGLSSKDSRIVWQRIVSEIKDTELAGIKMSMSVGIATYPDDGTEFNTLFKEADSRLYMAKRSGRGRIGETKHLKLNFESYTFVNRTEEKEILERTIRNGEIAFIKGQVGAGKTRLIRETLSKLKGWEILWATCLPFNYNIPYYPIRELIKYKIDRYGKDALYDIPLAYRVEVGKIVPALMEGIEEGSIESVGRMLDRYRLFEGVKRVLLHGDLPKVMIIDDIQWLDISSIEFLEYLMLNQRIELSFVFASRIEETSQDSMEFIRTISQRIPVTEIIVPPLSRTHVKELLTSILGHPLPPLEKYIIEKSAGNPFFIEELLKELHQNGFLYPLNDRWNFKSPSSEIVPRTIEDVIVRKFNALSEEARQLVILGSVAGEMDIPMLQKLLGYNEGHIIGLVEAAIEKRILKEESGNIKFIDELTRDTIYRKFIGKIKKRFYHKRIAAILEEDFSERKHEISEKLAYHYKQALVPEKCVEYSIISGDRAKTVYANEEALYFYTQALECLEKGTPELKEKYYTGILKRRAKILSLVGKYSEAIKDIEEVMKIAHSKGNKLEAATAYEYLSDIYTSLGDYKKELETAENAYRLYKEAGFKRGIGQALNLIGISYFNIASYEKALSIFEESLKVLRDTNSEELIASVYNNIGVIYNEVFLDFERAKEYLHKSLSIREKINDLEGIGSTLNNLGFLYDNMRDFEKSMKYYNESLELSRKIGDIEGEAIALLNIGVAHEEQDEFQKAIKYYQMALDIAQTTGQRAIENIALNNLAITYKEIGKYTESVNCALKSLELSKELNDRKGIVSSLKTLADIYLELDEIEKAEQYLKEALTELERVKDPESHMSCKLAMAEIKARKKNFKESREFLEEVEIGITEYELPDLNIELLMTKAEIFLKEGRIDEAEATLKKLKEKEIRRPGYMAKVWQLEARILAGLERLDESKNLFKKSIETYKSIGLKIGAGISLYHAAKALKNDEDFAQRCIEEARDIFKEIGAKKWENKLKTPFS